MVAVVRRLIRVTRRSGSVGSARGRVAARPATRPVSETGWRAPRRWARPEALGVRPVVPLLLALLLRRAADEVAEHREPDEDAAGLGDQARDTAVGEDQVHRKRSHQAPIDASPG